MIRSIDTMNILGFLDAKFSDGILEGGITLGELLPMTGWVFLCRFLLKDVRQQLDRPAS